jgi:hypothetical protein
MRSHIAGAPPALPDLAATVIAENPCGPFIESRYCSTSLSLLDDQLEPEKGKKSQPARAE